MIKFNLLKKKTLQKQNKRERNNNNCISYVIVLPDTDVGGNDIEKD